MAETEGSKRRGRPAKFAGERTRGALTIRLRDEVRSDLEQAAAKNGRSLSEEIETRMELSLAGTQQLRADWGDDVFRIAGAMAATLSHIESFIGSTWTSSDEAQELLQLTAVELIKNYKDIIAGNRRSTTTGDMTNMSSQELAQVFAALSGLAPPRPKRRPVELIISEED